MEDELLKIVAAVQEAKKAKRMEPPNAMFVDDIMPAVLDLVKQTLNKLVKDRRLEWHRTINDESFCIKNETTE